MNTKNGKIVYKFHIPSHIAEEYILNKDFGNFLKSEW